MPEDDDAQYSAVKIKVVMFYTFKLDSVPITYVDLYSLPLSGKITSWLMLNHAVNADEADCVID